MIETVYDKIETLSKEIRDSFKHRSIASNGENNSGQPSQGIHIENQQENH